MAQQIHDPVVYGLRAKGESIRYIGYSSHGAAWRLYRHRMDARRLNNLPVHRWLNKHGDDVETVVLRRALRAEELPELERCEIARARALGMELLNLTDGGEGQLGHTVSQEVRAKISRSLTGRKSTRASSWRHSPETKQRLSDMARGRRASAETKAKMSRAHTGLWSSEDHPRAKLTRADVLRIRELISSGYGDAAIARQMSCGRSTIWNIRRGNTWKGVQLEEVSA